MSNLRTYADGEPFVGVIGRASDESMDNFLGRDFFTVVSDVKVPAGDVSLRHDTVPSIPSTEGLNLWSRSAMGSRTDLDKHRYRGPTTDA